MAHIQKTPTPKRFRGRVFIGQTWWEACGLPLIAGGGRGGGYRVVIQESPSSTF